MCAATSHSTQQGTRGLPPRKRRRPTPLSDDAESETSAESGGAEPVESYSTGFEVYDPANYEPGMGEVSGCSLACLLLYLSFLSPVS